LALLGLPWPIVLIIALPRFQSPLNLLHKNSMGLTYTIFSTPNYHNIINMPLSGLFNKKGQSKTTITKTKSKASSPAIQQLSPAQQQQRTDNGYQLLGSQSQKKTAKKPLGVVLNNQI
jgi:hypothetical protein